MNWKLVHPGELARGARAWAAGAVKNPLSKYLAYSLAFHVALVGVFSIGMMFPGTPPAAAGKAAAKPAADGKTTPASKTSPTPRPPPRARSPRPTPAVVARAERTRRRQVPVARKIRRPEGKPVQGQTTPAKRPPLPMRVPAARST